MLVTFAALAVSACGDEPTEASKVAGAYNALVEAVSERDYAKACEQLSDQTRRDLAKAGEVQQIAGCDKTLERLVAESGTDKDALTSVDPSDVRIDGATSATVNQVRMSKTGDQWRVEGDLDFVRPFLSGPAPRR